MTDEARLIISSDTRRDNRIPPNQVQTKKWPVLHEGTAPAFDPETWEFRVDGLVQCPWRASWSEFRALPAIKVHADMHCVTRWSRLDMVWEGVTTQEVLKQVEIAPEARYVMVHCQGGYTTNVPLDDFLGDDCLLAWAVDGELLHPDHGGPVRLVIPKLYAWKSAKWVSGIELLAEDQPGYWEQLGYHMRGDPWSEQRYSD